MLGYLVMLEKLVAFYKKKCTFMAYNNAENNQINFKTAFTQRFDALNSQQVQQQQILIRDNIMFTVYDYGNTVCNLYR